MVTEFKSMRVGDHEPINVSKYHSDLFNRKVRPVHSAPYQARPQTLHFAETEIYWMVAEMIIEPVSTEW